MMIRSGLLTALLSLAALTSFAQSTLDQAYAAHQAKDYQKALTLYNQVLAAEPQNLDALWNRAGAFGGLENYQAALNDVKAVEAKAGPDNPIVKNAIGWFQLMLGQYAEAKNTIQAAYKIDSSIYMIPLNYGHWHLLNGDAKNARRYYGRSVRVLRAEADFEGFKDDFNLFIKKGLKADQAQKELEFVNNEYNTYGKKYIEINTYQQQAFKEEYTDKNLAAAALSYDKAARAGFSTNAYDLVIQNMDYGMYAFEKSGSKEKAVALAQATVDYLRGKACPASYFTFAAMSAANLYKSMRQFDKAATLYEECVAMGIKVKRDDWLNDYYHEGGQNYDYMGRKDDAIRYYKLSLEAKKKTGDQINYPITLNNLASVYRDIGQFKLAISTYEEALPLLKPDQKSLVAVIKSGLARCYEAMSDYERALKYYQEAYAIDQELGDKVKMAGRLNGIATAYNGLNNHSKALEIYDQALAKAKEADDAGMVATILNNRAAVKDDIGRDQDALADYRQAADLSEKLGDDYSASLARLNMVRILVDISTYGEVPGLLAKAEPPIRKQNNQNDLLEFLKIRAGYHLSQNQFSEAIRYYDEIIAKTELARQNATGDARAGYFAAQLISYQALAAAHMYNKVPGSAIKAFNTIEQARAKILTEKLSGSATYKAPTTEFIQDHMSANAIFLNFFAANTNPIMQVIIDKDKVATNTTWKEEVTNKILAKYEGEVNYVLQNQRGMKLVKGENNVNDAKTLGKLENIIAYYRTLLMSTGAPDERGFKVSSTDSKEKNSEKAKEIGKLLYEMLIKPIDEFLVGKTEIIIIPDGILGYLPFETLIDGDGKYMIEKYHITYVQSASVLDLIAKRTYPSTRKPMLAFGGGVYDEVTYAADMVDTHAELALFEKESKSKMSSRGSLRTDYAKLGVGQWANLPGTLSEVQTIQKTVNGAEVITGEVVSENKIKELSTSGALGNYKVLHFATHGIVVPSVPELSALVLSQFKVERNNEDGYLRMDEIENLKIKADYVNLSACETGLGKIYGGEGVVGLTQAFLVAGANGLSVSLWQVADESTSKFMSGMYDLTQKQGISYARAITEMKRRFLKGEFGEGNKNPYFWAPFVYYGK